MLPRRGPGPTKQCPLHAGPIGLSAFTAHSHCTFHHFTVWNPPLIATPADGGGGCSMREGQVPRSNVPCTRDPFLRAAYFRVWGQFPVA